MKKYFVVGVLLGLCTQILGQTLPVLEQNPASLKWFQLRTPHFRIIYPEGFDSTAQKTANLMQQIYQPASKTLLRTPRKISLVLQNQTTISNGFVTLLPRHSEFFATAPPQDASLAGTNDWLEQLAVHEFRHVVQYDKLLTGFSKGLYWVFGNNGLALIGGVTTPAWHWEGDAVGTETALTASGRGRIPRFDLEFRTRLLTNHPFSYPKAYCRSYKDQVPNHYVLGYFLTSYLRRHHGADVWGKVLTRHYRFPLEPFSFSGAIRKETQLKVEQVYQKTTQELTDLWTAQLKAIHETPASVLQTPPNRVLTNYEFPQYIDNETIICRKSGLSDVETYVLLRKNPSSEDRYTEQKLFIPGLTEFNSSVSNPNNGMLSVASHMIAWCENTFHPRWGMRDYMVIKTYDINTRKVRQLSRKSRLFAPSLSLDGKWMVAVEVTTANQCRLQLLNVDRNSLNPYADLQSIPNPENRFLQMPHFSADGKKIVVISQGNEGKRIDIYDFASQKLEHQFPFGDENISHPILYQDYVLYNSPLSGIDNIYALHIPDRKKYQVTSRKFGAYNPTVSPDGQQLAFNDFTPQGFRIATMPYTPANWVEVKNDSVEPNARYAQPLVEQEGEGDLLKTVGNQTYTAKRYHRFTHLINPYSWGPVVNSLSSELFAGVASQDLLNNFSLQGGVTYNANEQTVGYSADASYQGLFPILDLSVAQSGRQASRRFRRTNNRPDIVLTDSWNETRITAGIRLPFTFTHSRFFENLSVSALGTYTQISGYDFPAVRSPLSELENGTLYDLRYRLQYSRFHKQALRDLQPKWGQQVFVQHRHSLPLGDYSGHQLVGSLLSFVPGLVRHHGLQVRATYKYENVDTVANTYRFGAPITFVRGWGYTSSRHYLGASADYKFPLMYPDLALGRWLYIQRIKGNLFADAGALFSDWKGLQVFETKSSTTQQVLTSVGLDLSVDFNVMRLLQKFELGGRLIYFPQNNSFLIQPLVIDIGF